MKRTARILQTQLWAMVALSLCAVIVYESGLLMPGDLYGDPQFDFVCATAMELLTVCALPVAMRLFKFRRIRQSLVERKEAALLKWGTVRLQLLCVPLLVNTLLYYILGMNVAFGYMAIILLIGVAFVYPSRGRCEEETTEETEQ